MIYKPARTATQSGNKKTHKWLMKTEDPEARFVDPVMGWIGSSDTKPQIRLEFNSKEEAIAYALENSIAYRILEEKVNSIKPKSYASNFT